jgi:hypothetical protein
LSHRPPATAPPGAAPPGTTAAGTTPRTTAPRTPAPAPRPSATRCEDYDPIELFLTLQSGTTEEAQVFDSANGLDGTPYQTLLAGRSLAFTVGFGATDPADLVMEVTPGFDYEPVVYTS